MKGFLQSALVSRKDDCKSNELGGKIEQAKNEDRSYSPTPFRQRIAVIAASDSKNASQQKGKEIFTACIRSSEGSL